MEREGKLHLCRTAEVYAAAKRIQLPTLGRLAAGDWRFFDRLSQDDKTFTARKYDDVMRWFSLNWPADVEWPKGVSRPQVEVVQAAS